jgi:hypothetical protein
MASVAAQMPASWDVRAVFEEKWIYLSPNMFIDANFALDASTCNRCTEAKRQEFERTGTEGAGDSDVRLVLFGPGGMSVQAAL